MNIKLVSFSNWIFPKCTSLTQFCLKKTPPIMKVNAKLKSITRTDDGWETIFQSYSKCYPARRACALRALGLLLADGAPTVGLGKTFGRVGRVPPTKTGVTRKRKIVK